MIRRFLEVFAVASLLALGAALIRNSLDNYHQAESSLFLGVFVLAATVPLLGWLKPR